MLWLVFAALVAAVILAVPFIQRRFSDKKTEKGEEWLQKTIFYGVH